MAPTTSFGQSPGGIATKESGKEEGKEEKKVAKKDAAVVSTSAPAGSLKEVFEGFTAGAAEMEGKTFAKMAKDCKILDKNLTATDIDLIFAKVKDKAARKINYT